MGTAGPISFFLIKKKQKIKAAKPIGGITRKMLGGRRFKPLGRKGLASKICSLPKLIGATFYRYSLISFEAGGQGAEPSDRFTVGNLQLAVP